MKRLTTTNHFVKAEEQEYNIKCCKIGKKCVDDSNFQPITETLKRLDGKRNLSADEIKLLYDFADGKDNGMKVPFERSSANVDIAILTQDIKTKQKNISESMQADIEKAQREQARIERVNNSSNTITQ